MYSRWFFHLLFYYDMENKDNTKNNNFTLVQSDTIRNYNKVERTVNHVKDYCKKHNLNFIDYDVVVDSTGYKIISKIQ